MMGVAGCGKSSLAQAIARAEALPLVEGDHHHSDANRAKMRRGIPLTDDDRTGWLLRLGDQLRAHPRGVVLTCSALKRGYRDRLREATPDVRFVFMDIAREAARERVSARGPDHFFSSSLVDSQFATLESPVGEPLVLRVDALAPLHDLQSQVSDWLRKDTHHHA